MDEAASGLRLQQESKPEDILLLDQRIMTLQIELESLRKETDIASKERREKLQTSLKECQDEVAKLNDKWEKERSEIETIKKTKEDLEKTRIELDQAQRENNFGRAGELRYSIIPALEANLPKDGDVAMAVPGEVVLIHDAVTADDIAAVVSRVTGSK
jgi:ATP-dependent Clp protease ATP-binding subunit ClpB